MREWLSVYFGRASETDLKFKHFGAFIRSDLQKVNGI